MLLAPGMTTLGTGSHVSVSSGFDRAGVGGCVGAAAVSCPVAANAADCRDSGAPAVIRAASARRFEIRMDMF